LRWSAAAFGARTPYGGLRAGGRGFPQRSRVPATPSRRIAGIRRWRHVHHEVTTVSLLGLIVFLIAAIDMATSLAGLHLTSVGWSPLVFMLIAVLLFTPEFLKPLEQPRA
jgi:hypothetical protein